MKIHLLLALSCSLTMSVAQAQTRESKFAHFLEPGFPFAEIVVDARRLGEGFPKNNLTSRGLVVRLAKDTYIAYDTDLLRAAVAWRGGFLTKESLATKSYHKALNKKNGGQKVLPSVIGEGIFATGLYPGVQLGSEPKFIDPRPAGKDPGEIGRGALPEKQGRWLSSEVKGERIILRYEVNGVAFTETPWIKEDGTIGRTITIAAHPDEEVIIMAGNSTSDIRFPRKIGRVFKQDLPGATGLILGKSTAEETVEITYSQKKPQRVTPSTKINDRAHWPETITTSGKLGDSTAGYALDSIELPMSNSWQRNVRPSGIDFFPDGRAAIVTYDGDVWIVSGLNADLKKITWKRFAGGLHEPNSIRIRNGKDLFVFGRNGITELIDIDGDGEANLYRNHSSNFWQSVESRDFAHSMAFTKDNSLIITKGGQQIDHPSKHSGRALKISPDGKNISVFASGLRNAYLAIRPGTDEIYASDQEGHWIPASPLHRITSGSYYGFQPAAPWGEPEPAITPPLCWIPHVIVGSGLGPVWSDRERFGPLSDSLIYLDFQTPRLLATYLDDHDGQAATVPIPLAFDFPLLKGAINPVDGQLYLVGFQIWGTSAKKTEGMARLRYTGKPSILPTRIAAGKNAIVLHFDQALDPAFADFTVRRWNYKRSSSYGSGHYLPNGKAGEEIFPRGGVAFSKDRRSVLISTPDLIPVHQLAVSYELKTETGESFINAAYLTLHKISPLDLEKEGFPKTNLAQLAAEGKANPSQKQAPKKPTKERGAIVYQSIGCIACHSNDGSTNGKSGPTWKGLAGSKRRLENGTTILADTAYLRESILQPAAKISKGYNPKDVGMPSYLGILSDSDLESVILYIESLKK